MTKKQTILFFASILLLIVSEYYLLHELYNNQRISVILTCITGLTAGAAMVIKIFKRYRSHIKEL